MPDARSGNREIWQRGANGVALVCALLSVVVFVRRGLDAWETAGIAPGVAITSGCEGESFYAIWRAVHGETIYTDAARLPYGAAYFNWLFYAGYAGPVRAAVNRIDDTVIPRAGRLVTAAGALLGVGGLFWLLSRVLRGQWLTAAGVATFVYFGPLVGWWAHTVRPDVWALALETTGLALLLLNYQRRPLAAVLTSCLLFYGAWSFKQTYVLGLGGAVLFLLFRRQWRWAGILSGGSVVLWCLTFLTLGPSYRAAFRSTSTTNVYYLALGLNNLVDLIQKTAPLWLMAAPALLWPTRPDLQPRAPPVSDACLMGLLGLLVALPLSFAASCKLGAASYYYFTAEVMLALLAAGLVARSGSPTMVLLGFVTALGVQSLVEFGYVGQVSQIPQARGLAATWAAWRNQPVPRYASINNLNEPWLNPGSPPFVIAYNYWLDRTAGRPFETDGLGGLISSGYFRTLLLPADTRGEYDGGSLNLYVRGQTINGFTVFHRSDTLRP